MTKESKPTHTLTIGENGGETIPVTMIGQYTWEGEVYVQVESQPTKMMFTVPERYVKKLVPDWERPQPGEVWLYKNDEDSDAMEFPLRYVDGDGNFVMATSYEDIFKINLSLFGDSVIRGMYKKVLNSDGTPYIEEDNEDD
jgi:hypothetical protein